MEDFTAEVGKIHRRLNEARIAPKRANGLRLRPHERVDVLIAERDALSAELARIVGGMAEMCARESVAAVAAGVDEEASAESALVAGDGGDNARYDGL